MSITVNTNLSSLICQRSLSNATMGMNTALERMSTGLRINSAKDDAAGMAISSKMDAKLSSYAVAQDNAQMGQSMIDTASGSLSVMNGMLQRMRDLAEQAANGTYGKDERAAMQAEVDALTEEIYRIKNTTEFNGKKVLGEETTPSYTEATMKMSDVSATNWADTAGQVIGISSAEDLLKLSTLTNIGLTTKDRTFCLTADINLNELGDIDGNGSNFTAINNFRGNFDGNGYTIENLTINKPNENNQGVFGYTNGATIQNVNLENVNITAQSSAGSLIGNAINSSISNCNISGNIESTLYFSGNFIGYLNNTDVINCSAQGSINGRITVGGFIGEAYNTSSIKNCWCSSYVDGGGQTGGFLGKITAGNDIQNCSYDKSANTNGYSDVGTDSTITIPNNKTNPFTSTKPVNNINLQVGINSDSNSVISVDTGFEIGSFSISLVSEHSARKAIDKIDAMLEKINNKSLELGATSNRLTSTMEFQSVQMSALTSASSLIKDANIAKESASYIKNQILQQTTATLLATANQNPSIALSLV